MFIDLKSIQNMATNVVVAKATKRAHPEKRLITSHRLAMSRSLLNKRHSEHGAQLVGFQKPTGFQSVHVFDFKSIYMAPQRGGC
jgi:hypothetical protein